MVLLTREKPPSDGYPHCVDGDESTLARLVGESRARILELAFICAFAIGLALAIQAWAVKPFQIPSGSMEPTLEIGQRVLVERVSTEFGADPEPGDVIVFHPPAAAVNNAPDCTVPPAQLAGRPCPEAAPEEADENFIKRVVGVPGDRLKILDGVPVVNGERFQGDWRTIPCGPRQCNFPRPITIPPDHYFLMGDNRPGSDDSRFWGPIPREWIIGKAILTYWPPQRVGGV